jgi:hypothetical protein
MDFGFLKMSAPTLPAGGATANKPPASASGSFNLAGLGIAGLPGSGIDSLGNLLSQGDGPGDAEEGTEGNEANEESQIDRTLHPSGIIPILQYEFRLIS